jgi:hypothetical protein
MVCALVMHTEHDERLFAGALPHGGGRGICHERPVVGCIGEQACDALGIKGIDRTGELHTQDHSRKKAW